MTLVSQSARKLVFAAIFLAFCLIGWVARATLAQDAKIALPGPEVGSASLSPKDAEAPARVLAPEADTPVGSAADDPEKSALAFVEQNQKMAESQLKSLKAEQAKLQDRLRKVEAGIKRWESLLGALKQSQGSFAVASPVIQGNWKQAESSEPEPQRLAPVDVEPMPKSKEPGVKK